MHSNGEQHKKLIKDFLEFGTANGFGDLSMLVPWLFKAEASHSHLIEEVSELPEYQEVEHNWLTDKDEYSDSGLVKKSDVISLLKRKDS